MIYQEYESIHLGEGDRELNAHGTALYPVAFYRETVSLYPVPWHWHEDWEFILATAGQLSIRAGETLRVLSAGQALFLGPGALHDLRSSVPGSSIRSVVFAPRLLGSVDGLIWQKYLAVLQETPFPGGIFLDGSQPWHGEAIAAFGDAWDAEEQEPDGHELLVREGLSRMCFLLASHLPAPAAPSEREQRSDQRVKTMLQFIQEHFGEPITMGDIAHSAGVSERECLRCFRQVIGVPPVHYLRQLRVQRAAHLLRHSKETVTAIALACGFDDPAYFTRVFREQMGLTPREYRKNN